MAASTVLSGKGGDIKIGSTLLKSSEWSASIKGNFISTTNKGSAGWQDGILGPLSCEGSAKAYWDSTLGGSNIPPYATVFPAEGIVFELQLATQTSATGASKMVFTGIIESMDITSAVEGAIEYSINFKSTSSVVHTVISS